MNFLANSFESEESLWRNMLQGEKKAFERLMILHFKPLFNYGCKFTSDADLVKDCIQELFLLIWERREKLHTEVSPKAYLMASLRRSLHRKLKSNNPLFKYSNIDESVSDFQLEISIEVRLIQKELSRNIATQLAENIALLPQRQKEVVYLKFYHGMTRNEIAETMQISQQTVSNMLQTALQKMRGELQGLFLKGISIDPDVKKQMGI